MVFMECDILNLEWDSKGRDIDIVEPILSYLEIQYNLKILRDSIFNYQTSLIKLKPKMLIISNAIGAEINVRVVKFASKLGIRVVTLTSEGDYLEERIDQFFWGWNTEKVLYEDLHLQWSGKNINLINEHICNSKLFNIKLSGATGFDKYKFFSFEKKEDFLYKYQKKGYKKTVGIAGWGFDKFFGEKYQKEKEKLNLLFGNNTIENHKESKDFLKKILDNIIKNHKDILFILKHHPGMINENFTEFYGLEKYQNVLILRGKTENIADVISVSDIWIGYESTTCLEAWLLGKQTFLINPLARKFKRSIISKGSPVFSTFKEVDNAIAMFYETNLIPTFKDYEKNREEIINNVIGWDDGRNHIRAGDYIYDLYLSNQKKGKNIDNFVVKELMKGFIKGIIYNTPIRQIPFLRSRYSAFINKLQLFDRDARERQRQKYKDCLIEFYRQL